MKLNFWQWVGVVIVVIALIAIIIRETGEGTPKPLPQNLPAPTTSPA